MSNLPQKTIDKIKADAKAYMHNEIKGMVGDDDLQPHHLQYAHEAGATEWAERAQGLAEAIFLIYSNGMNRQTTSDAVNKALLKFYGSQTAVGSALAKYKEVSNDKETTQGNC